MCLLNKIDSYGVISKIIHWTTALIVLGLLSVGFYMVDLPFNEDKLKIYALHKSFGLLVLLLVFIRVAWHIISRKPKSLESHAKWEKALAHAAHAFLYFALFAMPLSGWVMSSAGDFTIKFFGIQMPDIISKNKEIFESSQEFHGTLALILIAVIGLHALGAFKHHFIDRDKTLARMSRDNLDFRGGALIVVFAAILMAPPAYFFSNDILEGLMGEENEVENAAVPAADQSQNQMPVQSGSWAINHEKSKISFEATQYGQAFEGHFNGFDGVILFDPQDLAASKVDIIIDTGSIKTGSDDRDAQALNSDWFDVASNPKAHFFAESFEQNGENQYVAHGTLSIRGTSLPLDLPFELKIEKKDNGQNVAQMKAEILINRLDFGVGQGEWKSTSAIGNEVKIKIEIEANK